MKLHIGDKVRVMTGKDKGKESVVERVYEKQRKVLLTGVNQYKRHMRKSEQLPQGGIIDVPRPMDVSKVMLIASDGKSVTRVGYIVEGGKKFRIEKKTGERIKTQKKK